jgi:xanthine dehydrogenase small subunit
MFLSSKEGERTIKVEDYFVGYRQTVLKPNEVISKIVVPKRSASLKLACHKISKRFEDDISTVCLVLALEHDQGVITQARCAMGGMAAIPARAAKVEQQLVGAKMQTRSITHAATFISQDFSPMSDVRATKEYRLLVSQNLMQRIAHDFEQAIPVTNVSTLPKVRIAHASL